MSGKQPPKARLAVTLDGKALPDDEARAIWEGFSAWMDAHEADFAGFARERGYASATPTFDRGRAVLVLQSKGPPSKAS